jgi:hypothetical protein
LQSSLQGEPSDGKTVKRLAIGGIVVGFAVVALVLRKAGKPRRPAGEQTVASTAGAKVRKPAPSISLPGKQSPDTVEPAVMDDEVLESIIKPVFTPLGSPFAFRFSDSCGQPWTTRNGGSVIEGFFQQPQQLFFVELGTLATLWLLPIDLSVAPSRRLAELTRDPVCVMHPSPAPTGAASASPRMALTEPRRSGCHRRTEAPVRCRGTSGFGGNSPDDH